MRLYSSIDGAAWNNTGNSVGKRLVAIFVAALALRVGVALTRDLRECVYPDSVEYFQMRDHLLKGEGLGLPPHWKDKRPPMYPIFLTISQNLRVMQVLQGVLGAATCVLAAMIARRLFGDRVALGAGAACAVYPGLVALPSVFIIETLEGFLLALAAWFMVRAAEEMRRWWAFGAGVTLGAAALTQASCLLLFAFWVLPLGFFRAERRWRVALALMMGAALAPAAWGMRNLRELGSFTPGTTVTGLALYEALGPQANGGPAIHRLDIPPEVWAMPELERDARLKRMALDAFTWERALKLGVEKMRRFWSPVPNAEELRSTRNMVISAASMGPMLLFFFYAMVRCAAAPRAAAFLFVTALYFTLVHAVFVGSIRYRLAIEPLLIVAAAWGAAELATRIRGRGASPTAFCG